MRVFGFQFVKVGGPLFVFQNDDSQQNVNYFLTPVFNSVFSALSHGALRFVLHGSSNIHFLIGWNSSTANQNISIYWFFELPWREKRKVPCERALKTVLKTAVKNEFTFCWGSSLWKTNSGEGSIIQPPKQTSYFLWAICDQSSGHTWYQ